MSAGDLREFPVGLRQKIEPGAIARISVAPHYRRAPDGDAVHIRFRPETLAFKSVDVFTVLEVAVENDDGSHDSRSISSGGLNDGEIADGVKLVKFTMPWCERGKHVALTVQSRASESREFEAVLFGLTDSI